MGESLHYGMVLRLYFDEKAFGPGLLHLLRQIEQTGSLQKAAQAMEMAYSKAWKMVRTAEKAWGFALTSRETGGAGGGGSVLTGEARLLMETYARFDGRARRLLDDLFAEEFSPQWQQTLRAGVKESGGKD